MGVFIGELSQLLPNSVPSQLLCESTDGSRTSGGCRVHVVLLVLLLLESIYSTMTTSLLNHGLTSQLQTFPFLDHFIALTCSIARWFNCDILFSNFYCFHARLFHSILIVTFYFHRGSVSTIFNIPAIVEPINDSNDDLGHQAPLTLSLVLNRKYHPIISTNLYFLRNS